MRTLKWSLRTLVLLVVLIPMVLIMHLIGLNNQLTLETVEAFAVQSNLSVLGEWESNGNFYKGTLEIKIQGTDGNFGGFLQNKNEPRDTINGKIEGTGDRTAPTKITFTRTRSGSFTQVYTGAAAYGPPLDPTGRREEILTGTFTHNGEGPYPWYATRIKVPK